MKNKYLLILFLLGVVFATIGAFFKIVHWEIGSLTGTSIIFIGLLLKVISITLFISKLISDKNNTFLNK